MKTINASEFKAKCLAILDEVRQTGEEVTILKHGKPVARLVPPAKEGLLCWGFSPSGALIKR